MAAILKNVYDVITVVDGSILAKFGRQMHSGMPMVMQT